MKFFQKQTPFFYIFQTPVHDNGEKLLKTLKRATALLLLTWFMANPAAGSDAWDCNLLNGKWETTSSANPAVSYIFSAKVSGGRYTFTRLEVKGINGSNAVTSGNCDDFTRENQLSKDAMTIKLGFGDGTWKHTRLDSLAMAKDDPKVLGGGYNPNKDTRQVQTQEPASQGVSNDLNKNSEAVQAKQKQEAERQRQQAEDMKNGYVFQGGLTWMPPVTYPEKTWIEANSYCATTTIKGQTGWRLPTNSELIALYHSEAAKDTNWHWELLWSSKSLGGGFHSTVGLFSGGEGAGDSTDKHVTTCVR